MATIGKRHGYNLLHEEKNPMQKKSEYVDKIKDEWALSHGIKLIRIWEHEINKEYAKTFKMLKEEIDIQTEKQIRKNNKNKRH